MILNNKKVGESSKYIKVLFLQHQMKSKIHKLQHLKKK
jgi:hypothetical protein